MLKITSALSLFSIAFSSMVGPVMAQQDFSDVEIKSTAVADGLYMLQGAGGNIGLSVGEDGAFVIDDQFAPLSDKIKAAIAAITDKSVEFVLNTHYHGDHTGGNEAFGKAGAHIVAHDNVRARLDSDERVPDVALPVITFSKKISFYRNGQTINVFHQKNAHTDGDAVVSFPDLNVIHMGDLMFSGFYPYIDVDAGGSINGYITALKNVHRFANDETKIIPGHGPLSSRADVATLIELLESVKARIQPLIDQGMDEDEIVARDPLAATNGQYGNGFINGERMTRIAVRSLTRDAAAK